VVSKSGRVGVTRLIRTVFHLCWVRIDWLWSCSTWTCRLRWSSDLF